jgi:RHH-type proline utilization regulon transcriptional repressor/proline dehydrogenase/delta 1-pyrroline-5-carboxylate dehydrogenase
VKRVIAEMGGKNAIIVDGDADLDQAVPGVLESAFGYQGQKCSACSRAVVHRDVYEAFLERLVEATRSLPIGPASDPHFGLGPLVDEAALEKFRRYLELGRQTARVAFEADPGPLSEQGHYAGPVILADVDPASRVAQEEIFGPLLCVIPAGDLDEALRIANGTPYGLTAGLYSRNPGHIARFAEALQAGNLYVNRRITGALVDRQPFGGLKLSGLGSKTGGPDYLLQFMQPVTVAEWTVRRGFAPPPDSSA